MTRINDMIKYQDGGYVIKPEFYTVMNEKKFVRMHKYVRKHYQTNVVIDSALVFSLSDRIKKLEKMYKK